MNDLIKKDLLEMSGDNKAYYLLGYAMAFIDKHFERFPEHEKEGYMFLKNAVQELIYKK